MLGDLDRYTRLQSADAIRDAARNPNGAAGAGMAIGVGAVVGQQVAAALAGRAGGDAGTIVCVVSGGNIDTKTLIDVLNG